MELTEEIELKEEFGTFLKNYPNHGSTILAFDAYKKARATYTQTELRKAAQRFLHEIRDYPEKTIPKAANWLAAPYYFRAPDKAIKTRNQERLNQKKRQAHHQAYQDNPHHKPHWYTKLVEDSHEDPTIYYHWQEYRVTEWDAWKKLPPHPKNTTPKKRAPRQKTPTQKKHPPHTKTPPHPKNTTPSHHSPQPSYATTGH